MKRIIRNIRTSIAPWRSSSIPPEHHGIRILRARTWMSCLLLGFCLVSVSGCAESTKRKWSYRSPSTNYRNALESLDADVRRDAVARIAESRNVDDEDAFHVLDAVARTDPVTQIRCIAIRAFSRYEDNRPASTLLTLLEAGPRSTETLPINDSIRWDAASVLVNLLERGLLEPGQQAAARQQLLDMIGEENPRRLRLVGLEGLGYIQQREVLPPLIRSLRAEEDFAIADEAETSLIRLTGTTHDYDPDAWEAWLARTSNPFEHAGREPEIDRPEGPSWWDRQKRAWRRGLKLGYE